jgi:hypothetical protein
MQGTISQRAAPLLDALARGAAAGAGARAQRRAADAAASLADLPRGGPEDYAALAADGRVAPALAAAICSRHACVAEAAMAAAAELLSSCPAAAKAEQVDALVCLGALQAAVRRLSAGGRGGGVAAFLVRALALGRPDDVVGAALAAGALPRLVALMGDADEPSVVQAATTLLYVAGPVGSPVAADAVDAGAVGAVVRLLGRLPGLSAGLLSALLLILGKLARAPAGGERLVADGALPHVVRLLRSPARREAEEAVFCLYVATGSPSWGAVAEALLADAAAGPALIALMLGADGDVPCRTASILGTITEWARIFGSQEALGRATGLAAAARRAGAVPRLVEVLRTPLEGEMRRGFTINFLAPVCHVDPAAAREALAAGAWPEACRVLVEQDALAERAEEGLAAQSLSLLAALARRLDDGAPRPAAEPGLVAALARVLGRVAARRAWLSSRSPVFDPGMAAMAAAVLEAVLEGSDGAQCAAEFVDAGGAGHLVRAGQRWGSLGSVGRGGLGLVKAWAHILTRRAAAGRRRRPHWPGLALPNGAPKPMLSALSPNQVPDGSRPAARPDPQHTHTHRRRAPPPHPPRSSRWCQGCTATMLRRATWRWP